MDLPTVGSIIRKRAKCGFLVKQGHKRKNWKRRFFILHISQLYYFESDKPNATALKVVDLDGAEIRRFPKTFKDLCFGIFTLRAPYYIQASTEKELVSWITAISRATGKPLLPPLKRVLTNLSNYSKSGYMEKQGIKVKNWKTRFFISFEGRLYYFTGGSTPLPAKGFITFYSRTITRLRTTFKGRPNSVSIDTGMRTYYLSCEIEEDLDSWISAMAVDGAIVRDFQKELLETSMPSAKKESSAGMSKWHRPLSETQVFGIPLVSAFHKYSGTAPPILTSTIRFLSNYCLDVEDIFVATGSSIDVQKYKDLFDKGITPQFRHQASSLGRKHDPHSVAGVLTLYILELPEPIIPSTVLNEYSGEEMEPSDFDSLFLLVNPENKIILLMILIMLKKILNRQPTKSDELLKVFSDLLMRRSEPKELKLLGAAISNLDVIFPEISRPDNKEETSPVVQPNQLEELEVEEMEKMFEDLSPSKSTEIEKGEVEVVLPVSSESLAASEESKVEADSLLSDGVELEKSSDKSPERDVTTPVQQHGEALVELEADKHASSEVSEESQLESISESQESVDEPEAQKPDTINQKDSTLETVGEDAEEDNNQKEREERGVVSENIPDEANALILVDKEEYPEMQIASSIAPLGVVQKGFGPAESNQTEIEVVEAVSVDDSSGEAVVEEAEIIKESDFIVKAEQEVTPYVQNESTPTENTTIKGIKESDGLDEGQKENSVDEETQDASLSAEDIHVETEHETGQMAAVEEKSAEEESNEREVEELRGLEDTSAEIPPEEVKTSTE